MYYCDPPPSFSLYVLDSRTPYAVNMATQFGRVICLWLQDISGMISWSAVLGIQSVASLFGSSTL